MSRPDGCGRMGQKDSDVDGYPGGLCKAPPQCAALQNIIFLSRASKEGPKRNALVYGIRHAVWPA